MIPDLSGTAGREARLSLPGTKYFKEADAFREGGVLKFRD
jgi:hypothetical protein